MSLKRKSKHLESDSEDKPAKVKVKVALKGGDEIVDMMPERLPKGRKKKDLYKNQQAGEGASNLLGHSWLFDKAVKKKEFQRWL